MRRARGSCRAEANPGGSMSRSKRIGMAGAAAATVALDRVGQVSSYGAQTFTWVIILAVAFLFPYALVIAELGSAFTQEGGPYEWMKLAWGRLVAGSGRGRRCRGRSGAGGRRGRRPGRGRCRRRRRG